MMCRTCIIRLTLLLAMVIAQSVLGESHAAGGLEGDMSLTREERAWIASHPVVRVRVSRNYPPFEFYDRGRFQGLAYDHLTLVGKKLGIVFEPAPEMPWKSALEALRRKSGVDLVLMITPDKKREDYIEFTREYISFPQVIFTRKDAGFVSRIDDLSGKTIATENDFIEAAMLRRDAPAVRVEEFQTTLQSLEAVSNGKVDAYVGNLAVASYLIEQKGLVNLKVAAPSLYPEDTYAMGVRKDWPELARIIDKALRSIPAAEHRRIDQKWLSLRYEHGIRPRDVATWLLGTVALALLFIVPLRVLVRKRTLELLQQKELIDAVMDNTLQLQGLLSPEGRLVKVNKRSLGLIGAGSDAVIGRLFWETPWWTHDPVEQERLKNAIRICARGETVGFETTHRDASGGIRYVDFSLHPLRDDSGAIIYLIPEGRDITERKKMQDELRRREQELRLLFSVVPVGIAYVKDGAFLKINDALCTMYGYRQSELLGRSLSVLCKNRSEFEKVEVMIRNQVAGTAMLELEGRTKDGDVLQVLLGVAPLIRGDASAGSVVTVHDQTERQQAEHALRESEKQLQLYFNRLPIACILWGVDYTVKNWNPAAERIFGYSASEALGVAANDLIVPRKARLKVDAVWSQVLDGNLDANSVNENVTKDGRIITCDWINTPFYDGLGKVAGVISTVQDITQRMHAEEMMIQNEKMSMVAGMAAGLAHEVNNPLGIIAQDLQNLQRRLSPEVAANNKVAGELGLDLHLVEQYLAGRDILSFISSMRGAVKRASGIISNMLQFSRLSNLTKQVVSLNDVIDQSLLLASGDYDLRKKYDFRNVKIVRRYEPGMPNSLISLTEMEQVFVNLLKNAAQAMYAEKTADPTIVLHTRCTESHVVASITDNGPGMSEAVRKRIFDPFFTTKDVGSGTGLGLSVSYAIVTKKHEGEISVESAPGHGTCFTVRLPLSSLEALPC